MPLYQRTCTQCGRDFEAKRPQAQFCGHVCRNRASRLRAELRQDEPSQPQQSNDAPTSPRRDVLEPTAVWGAEEEPAGGWDEQPRVITVMTTTHQALDKADALETPLGQAALQLAARMDNSSHESGAALAALAKQLGATLDKALAGKVAAAADPIDEMARRREARASA